MGSFLGQMCYHENLDPLKRPIYSSFGPAGLYRIVQ